MSRTDAERRAIDPETLVTDVFDLKALCLVIDLRSFTAAAAALGETKGTVSRRITRLERSLGVALLRRSPRLVEPTEDGLAYRTRVGHVLELLDEANTEIRKARGAPSGHLRVTAPTDLAITLFAPLIAEFGRRCPEVLVEMVLTERMLDLDADHLDVALRVSMGLPDSSLIAYPLLDLPLIGVASPGYLRAAPPLRRPADLDAHRIVFMGATRGRRTIALQRQDGRRAAVEIRLQSAVTASNLSFTKEVALAGGGVAFVPTVIVAREIEEGRLVRVLPTYSQPGSQLYLVHSGGRFMPAKVRVFRDFMLEAFGVKGRRGPSLL